MYATSSYLIPTTNFLEAYEFILREEWVGSMVVPLIPEDTDFGNINSGVSTRNGIVALNMIGCFS